MKFLILIIFVISNLLSSDKLEKVSLQLHWLDQFQFAGYYMAKEKGFYRDFGLDVEFKKYTFGTDVVQNVLDNEGWYGVGRTSLIRDKSHSKEILLMSAIFQSSPFALVSLKSSGIDTIEKFYDKRIMLNTKDYSAGIFAMLLTGDIGRRDFQRVDTRKNKLNILIDGEVDIASIYLTNEVYELKKRGVEVNIFHPKDYGFNFYSDILFTSQKEHKEHPRRVHRLNSASLIGWKYAFDNIEESVELILKKYNFQNKTRDALMYEANKLKELAYYGDRSLGDISEDGVRAINDIYRIMGMTKYQINFDEFVLNDDEHKSHLNRAQVNYIKSRKEPVVCIRPSSGLEYSITSTKYNGIMIDVLDFISKRLNFEFSYLEFKSKEEFFKQVSDGGCDIVSIKVEDEKELENFNITDTFLKDYFTILTKLDKTFSRNPQELIGETLIVQYKSFQKHLEKIYPFLDIKVEEDLYKIVEKIHSDKVYGVITLSKLSDTIIQKYGFDQLKLNGFLAKNNPIKAGFGVIDTSPVLLEILNKGLLSLDEQTLDEITQKWRVTKYNPKIDYTTAYAVGGILFIIMLFFVYRHYQTLKHNKKLRKQRELYDAVFENTTDSVFILDAKTLQALDCNEQAVRVFGYGSKQDVLKISTAQLSPKLQPNGVSSMKEAVKMVKVALRGGSHTFEWQHIKKNSEKFWTEVTLTSIILDGRNVIYTTCKDISKQKYALKKIDQQQYKLTHQATHDTLTGLPNRILLSDRIEQCVQKAKRNKTKLALICLDLDQFKQINDTLGHEAGDRVIKSVANLFRFTIREQDTLARLGGDEFAIIVEDLNKAEDASLLAQKIIDSLVINPLHVDGYAHHITCSIGISLYPQDASNAHNLLKYADTAMYKVKDEGRDNYQFYSQKMTDFIVEKTKMKNSLRQAIKKEEFSLFFQPQIDANLDTIIGMEALVRWAHPVLGLVSPVQFIPLAEETGMIVEIDAWVMKTAMKHISLWRKEGLNPGTLSLNLSAKELKSDALIQRVEKSMSSCNFNPNWLIMEVTEGHIMENPEEAIVRLKRLSDIGIAISIDDFGTGYSSLSYLKKLPVNEIKIDQSFIRDIPDDKEDVAIVKTIISLAKNLGLNIIAEGVETKEQRDFLLESGCCNMQGYYYAKPKPLDEMKAYILQHESRNAT